MRTNDNGIDREMTEQEKAAHKAWLEIAAKEQAAIEQFETQKAAAIISGRAKLAALGLTDSEIEALLGVSRG